MIRRNTVALSALLLSCLVAVAQADVLNMGGTRDPVTGTWTGQASLEFVPVGNPGNAADSTGFGSVGYAYAIGKYEVTAAQYTEFLNWKAKSDPYGLYDLWDGRYMGDSVEWRGCHIMRSGSSGSYSYSVASDWANRPVGGTSFWAALRFINWLNNGQGDGDTETGAYTLNGYNGFEGANIVRNAGAKYFLPSENEWYKAAYYDASKAGGGYWQYATRSDRPPSNALLSPDPGNNANFQATIGSPYYRTEIGAFANSASAYGTFDQDGNVDEWTEGIIYTVNRVLRGGDYSYSDVIGLRSDMSRGGRNVLHITDGDGFRVAMVPEPGSLAMLAIVVLAALLCWWRKRA